MKRIFFLNNLYRPNIGGIENSIFNLTQNLEGYDLIPVVITSTTNHFSKEILNTEENAKNLLIKRYNPSKYYLLSTITIIYNVYKILRNLKANSSDIYIIRDKRMIIGIKLAVPFARVKFLVPGLTYFQDFFFGKKGLKNRIFLLLNSFWELLAMILSSEIYVFSTLMSTQIKKVYKRKSTLVKPGVDSEKFKPLENHYQKESLRKEFGIPVSKLILLFTGRFSEQKGIPIILSKFLRLDRENHHLVLVGSGSLDTFIDNYIAEKNITNISVVRGTTSIEKYYQLADVFLMASEYEPFGQTILEAAVCNLPIISIEDVGFKTATKEILGKYGNYRKKENFLLDLNSCVGSQSTIRPYIQKEYSWRKLLESLLK